MTEMYGQWDLAEKFLTDLDEKIEAAARLSTIQGGRIMEAKLVGHMQSQDLGWKGLSAATLAYKKRKRLSNQILIATSSLMNSITIEVKGEGDEVFVGVLRRGSKEARSAIKSAAVKAAYASGLKGGEALKAGTKAVSDFKENAANQVLIMAVHEFGSAKRGIDARPLFRPTFKEVKPEIIANLKRNLDKLFSGLK